MNPSSSTTINTVPIHYESTYQNPHLPPRPTSSTRPTVPNSILKSSDDRNELRTSSSASFLDDVRRMDRSLQRIGISKPNKNEQYV